MEHGLLTIAIPTFNRANLLDKCLNSILIQIDDNLRDSIELIVSDNCSTDNTSEIVEKYIETGYTIKYIRNEQNLGPDKNIASCFTKASGKYVWILADDDCIIQGYLLPIYNLLLQGEWGNVYLSSLWYTNSYSVTIEEKIKFTIYDNELDYLKKVNYWTTFISGNIINKSLFADLKSIDSFLSTYLVQLSWVYPTIRAASKNVFVETKVIACLAENTGGYKLFNVFGKNFNGVMSHFVQEKVMSRESKRFTNNALLESFFPRFINDKSDRFIGENPFKMFIKLYWSFPKFWTSTFPDMLKSQFRKTYISMKQPIMKLFSKILFKIFNSQAYKDLEQKEKLVFRHLGEGAYIPKDSIMKNTQYVSIGKNFISLKNLRIEAWDKYMNDEFTPEISIGNNVIFNTDVHIGCINKVVLEDNVMIASRVYISDHSHGEISKNDLEVIASKRRLVSKGPVIIEKNVWIGEGACILPGVTIGHNSVIGANAVVTKSFPPYSIIGGVPARLIKSF